MTLLRVLVCFIGAYTVFALALSLVYFVMKRALGLGGITCVVNQLAGSKFIAAIEVMSWAAFLAWVVIAVPYVDLVTIQYSATFENGGITTYFGWMNERQADVYIYVAIFSVLGAKASIPMAEMANLLRGGRVTIAPYGPFVRWSREAPAAQTSMNWRK